MAKGRAKGINTSTKLKLDEALEAEDKEEALNAAFEKREGFDADVLGMNIATVAACWALVEASRQAKDRFFPLRDFKTKFWPSRATT